MIGNIGINAEQVSTNKNSIGYTPYEPMTKEFYDVTKEGVEMVYKMFLDRVAKGRNMTMEEADAVAQGRVWTGKEAKEIGLVDELGNLDDAVAYAAKMAEITEYKTTSYPRFENNLEDSFKSFPFMNMKDNMIKEELGEVNYKIYKEVEKMSKIKGIQARLPYNIDIK